MKTTILQLSELSCGHCVKRAKEALEALPGVESAEVTLEQAIVKGDVDAQVLVQTVIDAGYQAKVAPKETILELSELSCGHCVKRAKEALEALPGVESAEVTLDKAIIKGDVDAQVLVQTVIDAGYQAKVATKETILELSELSCGHCVKRAKEALEALPGVESAEVTLEQAIVKGDVDPQVLVQTVIDAGYQAKVGSAK